MTHKFSIPEPQKERFGAGCLPDSFDCYFYMFKKVDRHYLACLAEL